MQTSEEHTWAQESLAGDDAAFEQLVERYQAPLFNTALRIVGDHDDARDVVQAAFLKAYEKRETFDPDHRFFSWIYRILVNEAINLQKRRRRHEKLDGSLVSQERGPDENCHSGEVRDAVQAAISSLPIDQRSVIVLRHFGELSYRDLAYALAIPEKTVKSRLHDARRRVAELLRGQELLSTDGGVELKRNG